jgi:hypothetical protein
MRREGMGPPEQIPPPANFAPGQSCPPFGLCEGGPQTFNPLSPRRAGAVRPIISNGNGNSNGNSRAGSRGRMRRSGAAGGRGRWASCRQQQQQGSQQQGRRSGGRGRSADNSNSGRRSRAAGPGPFGGIFKRDRGQSPKHRRGPALAAAANLNTVLWLQWSCAPG